MVCVKVQSSNLNRSAIDCTSDSTNYKNKDYIPLDLILKDLMS